MKRIFDIVFSLSVLIIGAPFFLLMMGLIKMSSPGPIFYASRRVGRHRRTIYCWKFRSMYVDADERLQDILDNCVKRRREWETFWKLRDDPRITFIGKFIRATSIDELPQFYNVLRGDLSVVGPRPVTAKEIEKYYGERAVKILSVRPGITGIWQTSGRNNINFAQRVLLEEAYVEKRCLLVDLLLIIKTIPAMVFPEGAY